MNTMKQLLLFIFFVIVLFHSEKSMALDLPLTQSAKVDRIVIIKSKREMIIYQNGVPLKTYKIALGFELVGAKQFQGDGKTPEGLYKIDGKNPKSNYHKNLGISYPNAKDRAFAAKQGKSAGGDIKIHGLGKTYGVLGSAHTLSDWTLGCVAVTNEEIDEIYAHTPIGIPVEIKP